MGEENCKRPTGGPLAAEVQPYKAHTVTGRARARLGTISMIVMCR